MSFSPMWKWTCQSQSCLTLCNPVDCGPPGSSVHRIFQEGILSCYFLLGDLPNPGIKMASSALAGRFFTTEPPGKPPRLIKNNQIKFTCVCFSKRIIHQISDFRILVTKYYCKLMIDDFNISLCLFRTIYILVKFDIYKFIKIFMGN